ncbi:hypothetical protein [Halomonas sp. MCCC 1A11062]|uniref:hypothetical protein n=1 Tax=Halomonas sp. MCCC 1A11062 TaxID=2733485 RepID=UPI001F3E2CDD|nr:hypothetical protein [Halomonas sp. MCCC 1A11062]MCE8040137.1 hypothetical protein [Halomonas sp. MCCC 1A11062]
MAKNYHYKLDQIQTDKLFRPIRKKGDTINVLLEAIKIIEIYDEPPGSLVKSHMALHISKMSRIFFIMENKIFTINFPFKISVDDNDSLSFHTSCGIVIDSKMTSQGLSIMKDSSTMDEEEIFNFADPIEDASKDSSGFWNFFRELITYEDGYLRFDHDEQRANGKLHPLNHIDFFYSNHATFKVGLNGKYELTQIIDLLDICTDCHFLHA